MDVQDRTTRLDVVTAPSTPQAAGTSSTPAPDPNSPSFADSLARPTRNVSSGNSGGDAQQNFKSTAAETSPQSPAAAATSDPSAASSPSDSVKDQNSASKPISTPAADLPETVPSPAADAENAVDELIPMLIAELVAAATLAPPAAASVSSGGDRPSLNAPVSLMTALQSPINDSLETADTDGRQPLGPLPAIPSGLQVGLTQRSAGPLPSIELPTIELPAMAGHEIPAGHPTIPADQAVPGATSAQTARAAVDGVSISATDAPPAAGSGPSTQPAPSTMIAANGPRPTQDLPLQKTTRADSVDQPVEEMGLSSHPVDVRSKSQSPSLVARFQSTAKPAKDTNAGDVILDFSGVLASVPSLPVNSSDPSGMDGLPIRPVVRDSGTRPAQFDPAPLPSFDGLSPNVSVVASADLAPALMAVSPSSVSGEAPNVVEQLQPAFRQAISQDRELTMTLRPPELGAVRIDVQHRDGQLSARLHTETATAHQLLTEQLPQLRDVLAQLGIAADQVQVIRSESSTTSGPAGFQADHQPDARQSGGRQESPQQRTPEPQRLDEPEREDANRPAILTRTALNLRI